MMWNQIQKKLLIVLLAIGIIGGSIMPIAAEENDVLPLFNESEERPTGAIPFPEDLEFSTPDDIANQVLSFPAKFDLRDLGLVSSIKNQGIYGTCWTFGSMASFESSYLKRDPHVDNAECQLAWFNYTGSDAFAPRNPGDVYNEGGNTQMVTATLAKQWGIAEESLIPYSHAGSSLAENLRKEKSYELTRADYLDNGKQDEDQIEMIKRALTNGQVLAVSYRYEEKFYNSSTGAYYSTGGDVSHMVACIGWDDNYPKENFNEENRPQQDGAWIIKNSWGVGTGDSGYNYISYEETSLSGWTSFTMETPSGLETVYEHDELGMVDQLGDTSNEKGANIFVPETATESISAVGVYAPDAEVDYVLSIYKSLLDPNNPESGTLIHSQAGHLYSPGFYKLELPSTLPLDGLDPYSIVVEYTAASTPDNSLLPIEMKIDNSVYSNAKNAPGESFYFDTSTNSWEDFTTFPNTAIMNLCLKGYTVAQDTVRFSLGSGYVKAGDVEWLTAGGEDIYYTTDDSEPTTSSSLYDPLTGIDVSNVSVLKAAVLKGSILGPTFVANYEKATADVSSVLIQDNTGTKFYYNLDKIPSNLAEVFGMNTTYLDITPISTGDILVDGTPVASNSMVRVPFSGDSLTVPVTISETGKQSSSYNLLFEKKVGMTYDYEKETIASIETGWQIFDKTATQLNVGDSIAPGNKVAASIDNQRYAVLINIPDRPVAPSAPVASSIKVDEISLEAVNGGEYRIGDGPWQSAAVFSNLAPDTTYTVTQRYQAIAGVSFASYESQMDVRTLSQGVTPDDGTKDDQTKKVAKIPKTGGSEWLLVSIIVTGMGIVVLKKRNNR